MITWEELLGSVPRCGHNIEESVLGIGYGNH